jgi:hypothetical protein
MAALESFDDVRELDDVALRALLEAGRPEQRVWAIWALALRSVDVGEIARRREPDPGVRRNLAVVLAGHGELDLLVALARRDPAPEVRASAIQLVVRLAIDGKLPEALIAERVANDGTEVRVAVLGTVFDGAPAWLIELAGPLLGDPDSEVRYEAFEALARAGQIERALGWLEEAPEGEVRLALMRWTAHGRTRACAEALVESSRRLRRLLIESVRVATWSELAPVIGDEPVLVRALIRRNADAVAELPLAALLRVTLRDPSDAWILLVRDRLIALAHPDDELAPLLPAFRELCAQRVADLDGLLADLRARPDHVEDDLDALDDLRVTFEAMLEQTARLVVH